MKSSYFVLIFLFSQLSHALIEKKSIAQPDGSTLVQILYTEDGQYIHDLYRIGPDGWQDRLEQKRTSSVRSARQIFNKVPRFRFQKGPWRSRESRAKVTLWPIREQWSEQWEQRYSEWIAININPGFFEKHQIPTDCADVAFAIRWIFSRIHGLPAHATLAASHQLFTQNDGRAEWAKIPTSASWEDDQRFKTALMYVMRNTFTHSLLTDSYPVSIDNANIIPGTYYLSLREQSGHVRFVYKSQLTPSPSQVLRFVASDVPAKVRVLNEEPFSQQNFLEKTRGGFLKFRWPQLKKGKYVLVQEQDMPGFSLEQYSTEFQDGYYKAVLTHLGALDNPEDFLRLRLEIVWQKFQYRVQVVQQGYAICSVQNCAPGSLNEKNYSTPSRDQEIFELVNTLLTDYWAHMDDPLMTAEYDLWREKRLLLDGNPEKGVALEASYEELLTIWYYQYYSSDPRAPIRERWGF